MNRHETKRPPKWRPSRNPRSAGALFRRRQRRGLGGGFRLYRRLLLPLGEDELVALDGDLADLVHHRAGPGWDQAADDDVLLEAVERVRLAADCGFGEHARRLLE